MSKANEKAPAVTSGSGLGTTIQRNQSSAAQRRRLLARLRLGSLTTVDARRNLDIQHPAGRVRELRREGLEILTHREVVETVDRQRHNVARYGLLSEAPANAQPGDTPDEPGRVCGAEAGTDGPE